MLAADTAPLPRALPASYRTQNESPGGVLWMTGMSGAGKSTLARALQTQLRLRQCLVMVLDGDELRTGLNAGLGFTSADRLENVRRTAEVAALFKDTGFVVICALISPLVAHRELARDIVKDRFFEIHVDSSLACCEARDPKGLYARARRSEIPEFTGLSSPYEAPISPDLRIDTMSGSITESLATLSRFVGDHIRLARSLD
ncbi:adenylyl-sulfate kinase [Trinickia fusca]|uniref:Adenylyl-sulfate kinase n=2 Tax=Trinickia fusca TaxID=2419777 RepID=A0A494XN96_9BURK|nr:adenylyl-sulfate kinase [Trinickia fusca]